MILDDDDQTSGKIHLRFYFSLFSFFSFFFIIVENTHTFFIRKENNNSFMYIHTQCLLSFFFFIQVSLKIFFTSSASKRFFLDSNIFFFLIFVWCGPLQMSFFLHQTQYGSSHRQFPCEKKENPHDDHIFIIFEYAHTHKNHVFFNIINALGYERQTY